MHISTIDVNKTEEQQEKEAEMGAEVASLQMEVATRPDRYTNHSYCFTPTNRPSSASTKYV